MPISKILLIVLLLTPLTTVLAVFSPSESVSIELRQAVDASCDGLNDQPYSLNKPLSIFPQQCVMYKVSIKNISKEALYELVLKGRIPDYTQFKPNSLFVDKEGVLQMDLFVRYVDEENISIELSALNPLKLVTVFYAVVVD
jgi:hypothetical protein